MRLKDIRLWQICLVLALLPLLRFGHSFGLYSTAGYTGTIIIVDRTNGAPIEGATLEFTHISVSDGLYTAPFGFNSNPSDAQGVVGPMGMSSLADYHFIVTAEGYGPVEDFITIDGVENEKTVEMNPSIGGEDGPLPPAGYTFSWLDGVSLLFGLCTVGLYLKKPDATVDEITSLLA